jgi:DNA repair exonuclease SbcCD ATPase subunit
MRGLLSLDQELRALRGSRGQKGAPKSDNLPAPVGAEQPWQKDIDQVNQTMREVLRAIASFSGVELPGLPAGLQDDGTRLPGLDIRHLKDRFRNDLEGFSIKVTGELMKRAKEEARLALDAVQNEVGGRMEKIAADFRENSHLPEQIGKLLEPCVEDAEARLGKSLSQEFEHLGAQHEQLVQEKLQGVLSSFEARMSALEQAVQAAAQIGEPLEHLVEEATARLEKSLSQKFEQKLAENVQAVQGRLQESLSSVQAQVSTLEQGAQAREQVEKLLEPTIEQATGKLEKSILQKVEQQFGEREQSIQEKLQGSLNSFLARISALEQEVQAPAQTGEPPEQLVEEATARLERLLSEELQQQLAEYEKTFEDRLQESLSSVRAQVGALEQGAQAAVQIEKPLESLVEETSTRLERSISQKFEQQLNEYQKAVESRLQESLKSVQAQISTLEQGVQAPAQIERPLESLVEETSTRLERSISQKFEQQLNEYQKAVEGRLQESLKSVQAQISTLEQRAQAPARIDRPLESLVEEATARLEKSLSQKLQQHLAEREQAVQGRLQESLSSVQRQVSNLEQSVQQIRQLESGSVVRLPGEQPVMAADSVMPRHQSGLNNGLKGFLDQAFLEIQTSFDNIPSTSVQQSAGHSPETPGNYTSVTPYADAEMERRVQAALDNLERLGSKSPHPTV